MNRLLTPREIAERDRIGELERKIDSNRDLALTGGEMAGAFGFAMAIGAIGWMAARCGPTLLPWLFA